MRLSLLLALVLALPAAAAEGELPLSRALAGGDWGAVERLLATGADPNRLGGYRIPLAWSPTGAPYHPALALVHWCAAGCPAPRLAALLERGGDPGLADGDGRDPPWYAILGERDDNLALLLQALAAREGAAALARRLDRGGHLGLAAALGRPALTKRLLAAGADPGSPAYLGRAPLLHALENWPEDEARRPPYRRVAAQLLAAGEPFARSQPGNAVHLALLNRDPRLLDLLLEHGVRPTAANLVQVVADVDLPAPLQERLFQRLIEAGAPLDGQGWNGGNLLSVAAESSPRLIPRLLALGLDVNQRDRSGNTPLMYAAANGRRAAPYIPRLIEAGAAVEAVNVEGLSALMFAALRGHAEAARLLLAAGADPARRDRAGRDALELARRSRYARHQDRVPTVALLEAALERARAAQARPSP